MGYKKVAVIFIGFNTMMLIALIVAGLSREKMQHKSRHEVTENSTAGESAEIDFKEPSENLTLSDVGREVKEDDSPEEALGEDYSSDSYLLLVTSVASDMLIRILDKDGNEVSGKHFQATVKADGKDYGVYFDDDMDGCFYLSQMKPGRYEISVGGVGSSTISIRNNIKLTAINDIRKIVVDESSIDASKEDTAVNEEAQNEKESLNNSDYNLNGKAIGIDVSKYQKEIDWARVKAAGVEYAIIRAGYRGSSTGVLVKDPYFDKNVAGATGAGIKIGVYFFTQALNRAEAEEEAMAVSSLIGADRLSLPVYLDVESSGQPAGRADSLSVADRTQVIRSFCETMNSLGYRAGFYANKNWLNNKIDTASLSEFDIWLAQYRAPEPDYQGNYSIWQYTSKGIVDGINGFVDMDLVR